MLPLEGSAMNYFDSFFERQHTIIIDTFWLKGIPASYIDRDLFKTGTITDLSARSYSVHLYHHSGKPKRKPQFAPAVFGQREKLKAAITDSHGIQRLRSLQNEERTNEESEEPPLDETSLGGTQVVGDAFC